MNMDSVRELIDPVHRCPCENPEQGIVPNDEDGSWWEEGNCTLTAPRVFLRPKWRHFGRHIEGNRSGITARKKCLDLT